MIAIPAVDLREGCCVQLVGGDYDAERVRLDDPLAAARQWIDAGFRRLHVVDLDAAMGRGSNRAIVESLATMPGLDTQVGGGLRDTDAVESLLRLGVSRAVVGTQALRDPEWLGALAAAWPGRIVVAADARNGEALTHGWTASAGRTVLDVVTALGDVPLAGILVTSVEREGRMEGPDLPMMREIVAATSHTIIASGGIGTMDDLRGLEDAGVDEVVIGMALYSGALDPRAVSLEFGT